MPFKNICIPKEEQLEAIVKGLAEFYKLLERYLGDLNTSGDLRLYITITKLELIKYLRVHSELMTKHLFKESTPRYNEFCVLEFNGRKYRVYQMNHNEPSDVREYEDIAEATADYLMRDLGIYSN